MTEKPSDETQPLRGDRAAMVDSMCTWHSKNSPVHQQWLGYVYLDGTRLPIACFGTTEDEVKNKMRGLYAEDKEIRDENRRKREAAAEARAKKTEAANG
ncbi:MAG: hypothetical protein KIS86_06365 [Devosia sp.]|nr:hypothetical protein [Devosia sp.]